MRDGLEIEEVNNIMGKDSVEIIELARSINSWPQVLRTAMRRGGISDATMIIELKVDQGNFSRIMSGQASFPIGKLLLFCDIVGNDLPIHWLAYQRGYELRVIPKILEEQIEKKNEIINEKEERIAFLEGQIDLLKEVIAQVGININGRQK